MESRRDVAVETDVYSAFDQFLAQQVVAAFDAEKKPANPQMLEAVDVLRKWNGQMEKGQAAPMLASLVYEQIRKRMADRAATGMGDIYQNFMAPSVIEKLLRERPADWFPNYNVFLLRCLIGAIEEGQKIQGSKRLALGLRAVQALQIVNPVEGRLPLIGGYFNIGPCR